MPQATVSDRTQPVQIDLRERFAARVSDTPKVEATRQPMTTTNLVGDAQARVRGQWRAATVEVIYAQIAYAELVSKDTADDGAFAAAWLRLWRAQEHQRELAAELDQMDT